MADMIQTDEKTGVWRMDAKVFNPQPAGYIQVDGIEYAIYSFLDVSVEDSLKVVQLGDDINASPTYDTRLARSVEQIVMLNHGLESTRAGRKLLDPDVLRKMAPRQIIGLTLLATSVAQVPQKAAAEAIESPSDSPSSAPASAVSTDGDTPTSSS